MTGFGEENEGFGRKFPPELISCREIIEDDEPNNTLEVVIRSIDPELRLALRIRFEGYIMYLMRSESYTSLDSCEVRRGRFLTVYERSRLLDLMPDVIIHTEDWSYPGRGVHYGIDTCDHVIDVISAEPPVIEQLDESEVVAYV